MDTEKMIKLLKKTLLPSCSASETLQINNDVLATLEQLHTSVLAKCEADNKRLKKIIVGWLNWVYYLPECWKPTVLIEDTKQALKKSEGKE